MYWSDENIELIGKYLDGSTSPEESLRAEQLMADNPEEFSAYETLWQKTNSPSFDANLAWTKIQPQLKTETPAKGKVISFANVFKVAIAAALVGIGLFFLNQTNNNTTNQSLATLGDTASIDLMDGSRVDLAQNTVVEYKEENGVRKAALKGKAFFDIHRDTTKPFVIAAEDAFIQVLGTSFEVSALPNDSLVLVTVRTGKVMVYAQRDRILNPSEKILLIKGEKGCFNKKTGELRKIMPKTEIPAKLRFKDMTLKEMCSSLENIFNITISLENENLSKCGDKLNFKISNPTIESSLRKISEEFEYDTELESIEFIKQNSKEYLVKGKGC